MEQKSSYRVYSSITEKDVEWLWYPYIPYGKITLLQGDPGDGKSTFMLNLSACLTNGSKLPDGTAIDKPENVIYQCAEDSFSDTIKPRLIQAGADCSRVAFIEDEDMSLSIADSRIENAVRDFGARLLILDPIQAFISQDGDMQSASRMRSLMRKLSETAEKYHCAIVLIGHMTKASGGKNLYRGLGSIDIAAIARSVLMISRDTEEPQIRYMFPVKASLAPEGCAIGFIFDSESGFHWIGKCNLGKREVYTTGKNSTSKKEKAKSLLKVMLSVEDLPSNDIFERMEQIGIKEKTVRIAQKELEIVAYQNHRTWYWHLPDDKSMETETNFENEQEEQ